MAEESSSRGVTPEEVMALAAKVTLGEAQDSGNPVFASRAAIAQAVTTESVQRWIDRVDAVVSTRLYRRRKLTGESAVSFAGAMATAVEVGAAAYVVDAAYPERAGVNDAASYGSVLWSRYRQVLEDLEESLEGIIAEDAADDAPVSVSAGGQFPAAIFTDQWVRESAASTLLPGTDLRDIPAGEAYRVR